MAHSVHSLLPESACQLPFAQLVHAELPDVENVPGGHAVHTLELVALTVAEYLPPWHGMHESKPELG